MDRLVVSEHSQESHADAVSTALRLLASSRHAMLATLEEGGAPFASLAAVAPEPPRALLLFLSDLAWHTHNLKRDPRASLLVADLRAHTNVDPLTQARISLLGRAERVHDTNREIAAQTYLAHHPTATAFTSFADFAFYRFSIERVHIVAGFGRIATLNVSDIAAA